MQHMHRPAENLTQKAYALALSREMYDESRDACVVNDPSDLARALQKVAENGA